MWALGVSSGLPTEKHVEDCTDAEILAKAIALGEAEGHHLDWKRLERFGVVEWLKDE